MSETNTQTSYQQSLIAAGLTPDQAVIYEFLLKNGAQPAGKISIRTPIKRGLVYKLLEQLQESGLVIKREDKGKVAVFEPGHPVKIKELAEKKETQAKNAQDAIAGIMEKLSLDFNLISNKPGFQYYEGVEGIKKIYDDILETNKHFYLVRSIYEPTYNDKMLPIVKQFVTTRVKKGIPVTAITPEDEYNAHKPTIEDDKKVLMKRVLISKDLYNAPVEIDIYGDKVAFLSFGQELIAVVIQSPQISLALQQLFLLAAKIATPTPQTETDKPTTPQPPSFPDSPVPNLHTDS